MEWIQEEYKPCFDEIVKAVEAEWKDERGIAWFTPHGPNHNRAVERNVRALCAPAVDSPSCPSPMERFILSAASWLHDMGACPPVFRNCPRLAGEKPHKLEERARYEHHVITADYIKGDKTLLAKMADARDQFASAIAIVSFYHRRREPLGNCPEFRLVSGQPARLRLLSALLRLADGIHISSDRCSNVEYQLMMMGPMPWESQFHWLKSFAVSEIRLDHSNNRIQVQIDVPQTDGPSAAVWRSLSQYLAQHIRLELEEELDDVNKVLALYQGFPTYWKVDSIVQEVPGFPSERAEQLKQVLHDKEIAASPNAGRVLDAVLATVSGILYHRDRTPPADLVKELAAFRERFVERFIDDRPCHVALVRVKDMLAQCLATNVGPDQIIEDLKRRLENIRGARHAASVLPDEEVRRRLEAADRIFVFAYSSTVGRVLSCLSESWKASVEIIVGECRTKSKYTFNNRPLYLDGLEYAKLLHEKGLINITMVPDTEIASRLAGLTAEDAARSLVLFGANGVRAVDGLYGYSAGHRMIALVARRCKVPVWALTESIKIGRFRPCPELLRGDEWFSTHGPTREELERYSIRLSNLREDAIPFREIDLLVTERGEVAGDAASALRTLQEWSGYWDSIFGIGSSMRSSEGATGEDVGDLVASHGK